MNSTQSCRCAHVCFNKGKGRGVMCVCGGRLIFVCYKLVHPPPAHALANSLNRRRRAARARSQRSA